MRDIEALLGRIARLETSIAAIEQALTRYRFAMQTIPADDGPAHADFLKMLYDYEESLRTLHALRNDAFWDLEAARKRGNAI